ncbi:MAG: glycerol-3-phosphate dehydrogenase/oxidase, partial [Spirochaetia bacterium]|nr:glycerol-3-phosphate dehydrogenase/oxidase [Spirochaetia bacterium]
MRIVRSPDALNGTYDIVVLGGGITGTAIAREAAVRGLSVCLVEKNDFGWSTSAATSKLLHGGLRYLEHYEFSLVRESLRERRILGCAAPHLIQPLPFILPIYKTSRPGRYTYQAGLILYDLLSFERNWPMPPEKRIPAHRWLSKAQVIAQEPLVDPVDLKGGFQYYDYQSLWPERLTLAFIKTAVEAGAVVVNHAAVEDLETTREPSGRRRVTSVKVRDLLNKKLHHLRGRMFINASGPWTDIVLGLVEKNPVAQLSRSKGVHLLTDSILGTGNGVIFRTRAGGHFFILPWMGSSLIGPTDAAYQGHPDHLAPEPSDVQELIDDVNAAIPGEPLKPSMIKHVVIGLRPLIASKEST